MFFLLEVQAWFHIPFSDSDCCPDQAWRHARYPKIYWTVNSIWWVVQRPLVDSPCGSYQAWCNGKNMTSRLSGQPIRAWEWYVTSCSDLQKKKHILHTFWNNNMYLIHSFLLSILLSKEEWIVISWPYKLTKNENSSIMICDNMITKLTVYTGSPWAIQC